MSRQTTIDQWETADLDREFSVCRMMIEEIEQEARERIIEMMEDNDDR